MKDEKMRSRLLVLGCVVAGVVLLGVLIACLWLKLLSKDQSHPETVRIAPQPVIERIPIQSPQMMDYNQIQKNPELQSLIEKRKKEYGIDTAVDMIAKPDETLKVGNEVVPMKEILDKIRLNKRDVTENDLTNSRSQKSTDAYGIYVVQPGDNIWDIHYRILRGFFAKKGITLPRWADQPKRNGKSSGIGKILKFSETMVFIYNIHERNLETDLNLIRPLSKIAIFNMDQVLGLLDQIDYQNVDHIQFDGKNLWMPAQEGTH